MKPVRLWVGIVLLALGVFGILDATGVLDAGPVIGDWWPAAVVVLAVDFTYLGPVDDDCAEALQLSPRATIKKRIIAKPVGRNELQTVGWRHRRREIHKTFESRGFSTIAAD